MQITLTNAPDPADIEAVVTGLRAFNRAAANAVIEPLGVFVRDEEGRVIGGLTGRTGAGWLFIEFLWLADNLRGKGLGADLMARAEAEAVARGCKDAWVDTFGFQAPGFYDRLGYEPFGVLENYPEGHRRYFLKKRLATDTAAD